MSDEMKKVKGPDGKVYKFPSDMSFDRIDEIMTEQYPSNNIKREDVNVLGGAASAMKDSGMFKSIPVFGAMMDRAKPETQERLVAGGLGAVNGLTLGFGDEIAGAVNPDLGQGFKDSMNTARAERPAATLAGEVIGGAVTGARAFAPLASTKMGAMGAAAAEGGLYGIGSGEGLKDRAAQGVIGAGVGAAGGKLLEVAGGAISNLIKGNQFLVNGTLTNQARKLIESAGVNPNDLTPDDIGALVQSVKKGVSPDAAARSQMAQSLPVEVPLTTGQITQNPDALRMEASAFDGRFGSQALGIADEAKNRQQQALQDNADAIRDRFTQRGQVAPQDGGALVSNRIQNEALAAKDEAKRVRATAKNGKAYAPRDVVKNISDMVEQRLKTGQDALSDDEMTQVVGSLVNPAKRVLDANKGDLNVNMIIGLRRTISNASSKAQGSAKNVLGEAKEMLDGALFEAAENALITGDEEAVKAWSKSTQLFADYYKKYEGKAGARKVIANIADGSLESEEVSKILLGARGVKQSNRGLALARELKAEMGIDSPEWQSIRGEALTRLIQDTGDASNIGLKFSSELERALTDHPAMMRELFSADEVQMLRQFGRVVKVVNSRARSTGNPSQSGDLLNFMSRIGGGKLLDFAKGTPFLRDLVQTMSEGSKARKVNRLVNPK